MILTALKELAEREGLAENPDYQPIPVRWLIDISEDGTMLGVRDTVQMSQNEKAKPEAKKLPIPKRSKRTSGVLSEFVVDKPSYVFGWVHPKTIEENRKKKKKTEADLQDEAKRQHETYLAELRVALSVSNTPGLAAWLKLLE